MFLYTSLDLVDCLPFLFSFAWTSKYFCVLSPWLGLVGANFSVPVGRVRNLRFARAEAVGVGASVGSASGGAI